MMKKVFITENEQQTAKIAAKVANIAQKGDAFALYGTLGMGKSVFARAFIQELTQAQEVPSPTFTLVQSYPLNDMEIYHFDLYRLKSPEEAVYGGISIIEWPEKAGPYLPKDIFKINITNEEDKRIFEIITDSPKKQKRLEMLNEF